MAFHHVVETGEFVKGQQVEDQGAENGGARIDYLALQGAGTATYPNGTYEGQRVGGMEHGLGRFTYANGGAYEGEFKDGLPDGNGNMVLQNGTTYQGTFTKGYFVAGSVFKFLRDVQENEVIVFNATQMVYVKGWKNETIKKRILGGELSETVTWREVSTGLTMPPDMRVEVLGWRNDDLWRVYGGFVNKVVTVREGETVENKSTYGYHDSKKSANVVVNTTVKTDVPAIYKTIRVPCEGCDASGYKIVPILPLDRSKFTTAYQLLPHELVMRNSDENQKLTFERPSYAGETIHYEGGVVNGKANGYGVATTSFGQTYYGEWKDNDFNGQGSFTWANGDHYSGSWLNGYRTGKGAYVWSSSGQLKRMKLVMPY